MNIYISEKLDPNIQIKIPAYYKENVSEAKIKETV
jgi:hypothetical protein